jgi:4-aminobutyrate aminotransferase-like enzyme
VVRLIPPLTIPEAELDAGLDIFEAAVREEVAR